MTTFAAVNEIADSRTLAFREIEPLWQARWEAAGLFHSEPSIDKPNWSIMELPPFANGRLHLGHVRNYTMGDVSARFRRMAGYNVLYTSGFDSFGLPNELAAREADQHPKILAEKVIAEMRKQFVRLGLSHDTRRIIGYHDEEYYAWVQWVFLKLFEQGFIYRKRVPVNFCPKCQITLADSLAEGGRCWRCATAVEVRSIEQWLVRESHFAEQLLSGLDNLRQWPAKIKRIHTDWIGKQNGVEVRFAVEGVLEAAIVVFVPHPELLPGATVVIISPDHPLLEELRGAGLLGSEIDAAIAAQRADVLGHEQGEFVATRILTLGVHARNPLTGTGVPIAVSFDLDQRNHDGVRVLFPAHVRADARACAELTINASQLIRPAVGTGDPFEWDDDWVYASAAGELAGRTVQEGCAQILRELQERGCGTPVTRYRLRDWNIARQRYWGPPVPIIHCARCGAVPVPCEDLPVRLPMDVDLDTYDNPLKAHPHFVNVPCPTCGQNATRDSDTLEAYSSPWWYHWNCKGTATPNPFDLAESRLYIPINLMVGGEDQARTCFFHVRMMARALKQAGVVEYDEPIDTLLALGMVRSEGRKMSKSEGNVVDPDAMIQKYGADSLRFGILSAAAPESDLNWSENIVRQAHTFLNDVWRFFQRNLLQIQFDNLANTPIDSTYSLSRQLARQVNTALERTTKALCQNFFHLATSNLLQLFQRLEQYEQEALRRRTKLDQRDCAALSAASGIFLRMLAPLCPHIAEEIWTLAHGPGMIAEAAWPMQVVQEKS
jgi:leucyl-tRNA synthetase